MRVFPEAHQAGGPISALSVAGFLLTLHVFWPGVMTFDARYIHEDMAKAHYGDWQSPAMTWLWSQIDPIAPGAGSMLLLNAGLYWLAFCLLALAIARRSPALSFLLLLLALSPPVFVFLGIIWRDVLFMAVWLLGVALVFVAADCGWKSRLPAQTLALALVAFGVLIRPNAIPAAPLLAVYVLWPAHFSIKRAAIVYLPAALAFYGLMHVIYYEVFHAERQHPLHSIMVFDLGGISHFAKDNQFPGHWSAEEAKLIADGCYSPERWDVYWTIEPCNFVMRRLEAKSEKIFGTPALTDAWAHAILRHPLAYLQHRATFMGSFLTDPNLTIWEFDVEDTSKLAFAGNTRLMALKELHDILKPTPLFRAATWLALGVIGCFLGWRRRHDAAGMFALAVCGAGTLYVMTFAAVGVATDFRYGLWTVAASLVGLVVVVAQSEPTPRAVEATGGP